jgi:hypothetical protein
MSQPPTRTLPGSLPSSQVSVAPRTAAACACGLLAGLSFARAAARLGSCARNRKRAIFESGEGAARIDGSVS